MVEKHLPAKPAKEVFQPLGVRDFETKLSDIFRDMNKKEVDTSFKMADGTNIRVFGFRARKGIILEGEACIEIMGSEGESGGIAYVHLRKNLFNQLDYRKAFYKPKIPFKGNLFINPFPFKGNFIRAEMLDELGKHKEFQNIVQVLDLFNSQNITPRFYVLKSGDEGYVTLVKKKYELALRVKTLENEGLPTEEAVRMVVDESKKSDLMLSQFNEYGMKPEATVLVGIMRGNTAAKDLDALAFIWSCRPPANSDELAFCISGCELKEVKKFMEGAIAEADKEVKKWEGKASEADKLAQSSPNAAWQKSRDDDLMLNSAMLKEERMHLENLRKAYEMLCSYKPK